MKIYFALRYITPILLMIGWVVYQMLIKRKKWDAVQGDALTCCVFAIVWMAIAHWLTS